MRTHLTSSETITRQARSRGLNTWEEVCNYVQYLPYGRNSHRADVSLVLSEEKGTCSSKHAYLKQLALENDLAEIQLFIGIYKMDLENTPGINLDLQQYGLAFLPEAHCYLKINGVPLDITSRQSNFKVIESVILEEIEILPSQVGEYKVAYHQRYIQKWIKANSINQTFSEIWAIREQCIQNLTQ